MINELRILIVDNDSIAANVIKEKLVNVGYTVAGIASTGQEALEIVQLQKPDLILMDIKLQNKIQSVDLADIIREQYDIPVIHMTAHPDENVFRQAKITAPFDYLSKPFDEKNLYLTIEISVYKHTIEKKLKENELKFRTLAEVIPAVIYIVQNSKIVYANPAAEKMIGYSQDELKNIYFWEIMHPDIQEKLRKQADAKLAKNHSDFLTEVTVITKNNEAKTFFFSNGIIHYNGLPAILGIALDVTENKIIKEELDRSKRQFQLLYDQSPNIYFTINSDGIILSVNQFGVKRLGYEIDELIGESIYKTIHKDDREIVSQQLMSFLNKSDEHELSHLELRKLKKDGTYIWVQEVVRAIKDIDGNDVFLIACEDISQLKESQLEKENLKIQLAEKEKLITLGQFTAAITHEINNPLDSILSLVFLLKQNLLKHYPELKLLQFTDKIKQQTLRISSIIKDIMSYVTPQKLYFISTNINDIMKQVVQNFSDQFGDIISFDLQLDNNIPKIKGDPLGLEVVFKNLVQNAIESYDHKGAVSISLKNIENKELIMTISDKGKGIDEKILNKIFEPFFKTSDKTNGAGLGLSICKEIVEQHDGSIHLESEVKKGTSVTLRFPVQ